MPFFWGVFFQISSLWVFQAADMDCTFGNWTLPYAEVGCLNNLADIVLIPLFDQLLYPALTYIRIAVTPLRKMISGFVVTCIASCVAGLVQIAMENNPEEPISVLLILPQYILISMAEILLSPYGWQP
ncbi:POT family [Pelomyxa schiedti]|nr:POT family [Pelomyxa schiedti]